MFAHWTQFPACIPLYFIRLLKCIFKFQKNTNAKRCFHKGIYGSGKAKSCLHSDNWWSGFVVPKNALSFFPGFFLVSFIFVLVNKEQLVKQCLILISCQRNSRSRPHNELSIESCYNLTVHPQFF